MIPLIFVNSCVLLIFDFNSVFKVFSSSPIIPISKFISFIISGLYVTVFPIIIVFIFFSFNLLQIFEMFSSAFCVCNGM